MNTCGLSRQKIPARFQWAIETMALRRHETVLEIGCGTGLAASLAAEQLSKGTLFLLDRSPSMIDKVKKLLAAGSFTAKIKFICSELSALDIQSTFFDTIYAFNVNVFWTDPNGRNGEFEILRRLLNTDGRLFVFYQLPAGRIEKSFLTELEGNFRMQGFKTIKTHLSPKDIRAFGLELKLVTKNL